MTNHWTNVQIREVAILVERPETPIPGQVYRQIGVRLWGQGAYERETMDGGQTRYTTLNRVEANDIIVNKIWARNGSVAVVSPELSGCYGSGEFPTFAPVYEKLYPRWFHWITKTPDFWQQCDEKSQGTSGKNRIRPEQFLNVEIPLPPLAEQQRIVARIEALAQRVEEARGLRRAAVEEAEALLASALRQTFRSDAPTHVSLESVCDAIIDNLHSNPAYSEQGTIPCIRSSDVGWGKLFLHTAGKTTEEEYEHRTVRGEPRVGDIVLVREGGGTGKAALVENGHRFSLGQRVMMLRPNQSRVLSKFFLFQILSPEIYEEQILPLSKGSASPHLNIGSLRKFRFLLPPLTEQRYIVAYLDDLQAKVDELKRLQAETQKELDALMPSILAKAFAGEL